MTASAGIAAKDRLYRCLDRIVPHKAALFQHLRQRWQDLFGACFEVLLYDLTSTYFEGQAWRKTLVITPKGFPLAYEVMDGNTSDRTTLQRFLRKIEMLYGKADRIWVMDRGIPTEAILREMREAQPPVFYLVGTPRGKIRQYEQKWLSLPWQKVRDSVEVKLFAEGDELYVLAKSEGRRAKEMAIRQRKLVRLLWTLRALRQRCPSRDQLLLRIGAAKTKAGRAYGFVEITLPHAGQAVTQQSFRFRVNHDKLQESELRDGHYLLRSNLVAENPALLWERYTQLVQIEAVFRSLKTDLKIRPIHHQLEHRVEAHILIAFLAYSLMVTLKQRLQGHAPGLTAKAVLEKLATIQMLDVWLPTTDGRYLIMPRYTQPEAEQTILLHQLRLTLPAQPQPRIRASATEEDAVL